MSKKPQYGIPIDDVGAPKSNVDGWVASALTSYQAGRLREAADLCRKALASRPRHHLALQISGVCAFKTGDVESALTSFRKAVEVEPGNADGYNNLGNVLVELGRYGEAVSTLEKATELNPQSADAHNNLGRAYAEVGRHDDALRVTQAAAQLNPALAEAFINLGKLLMDVGLTEEGLAVFQHAIELAPHRADAHGNLLMCMQYSAARSGEDLVAAARQWARTHAPVSLAMPPAPRYGHERLRVGYVSGDLRAHPVGYTMERLLAAHDRTKFEVYAYSNCPADDEVADRLRQTVDHWLNVSGLDDDEAAQRIRRDEIDILIDLSGYSALNRLGIFARKPARVQATWLGYFASTGMPQMDYVLRDRAQIPPAEEGWYVERTAVLPDDLYCFAPPHERVDVTPPPCLTNGYMTFGCFNNLSKTNDLVIGLWSRVLKAVPGSKLRLDRKPLAGEIARQVMTEAFARHGTEPDRLLFAASPGREAYLNAYAQVDVMLDTFPFNGATTTYESLWMGVPVLTRTWDRMVGHFGEAILSGAGRREWIARSDDEYVEIAVRTASDPARLAEIRKGLREEFLNCPLCAGESFAPAYEDTLRTMWESVG